MRPVTTRDRVAAVLTAAAIASGTVGGFCVSAAAGFFAFAVLALAVALVLGFSDAGGGDAG